ncbi:hypothetical protein [Microbacterium hydrocarbonoxydans]|uniref:hypothetical protein n=1 Tax=Microbacterium hydrocarbonoxydans TaxID=273678 RepID=UPI002041736A|nr:hypothetical protein [Microbacterium hydrocarbonoxydans]MCM3778361.1 hypothetical protein [Microbacterium hydrocarbonoxydans]
MGKRFTPEDAGYILYSDVIERLRAQFPTVPEWRLEQIVTAENEAITGGMLSIVPEEVETGAVEMLTREENRMSDDDEVA